MKIMSIIGTRPEAIKMAPVIQAIRRQDDHFEQVVVSTGQHREMLKPFLDIFELVPDVDLDLMQHDQGLTELTARLLVGLDGVVQKFQPDWLLAQGDTTSVLAAGLVSFYNRKKFGHVEAGLRTSNRKIPFPEEMNRRMADVAADLHFAPTQTARKALLSEGYDDKTIRVTGNTVIDAVRDIANRDYDWKSGSLKRFPEEGRYVLITAHRRESFGEGFQAMCRAMKRLANDFSKENVKFIYPVHLNPNVRKPVMEVLSGIDNLHLIEPLDYPSLVQLMKRSLVVLTDSGGIQEEAPGLGVPVVLMREETERPEGIEAGVVQLAGSNEEEIVKLTSENLRNTLSGKKITAKDLYGDGTAGEKIAKELLAQI